ncbi:50S ribosomal protein L21 [candidate division WWE3 bacterium]|uniref:Large ribosomal subunit protein bL21 n=1 Tax=candidate division WWE3 bacterium TaxID=2053526 RepID=A0A955LKT5_UNCKA|nr:50S ribosomal protein L21 [candidate division WWE3 bacterium]
MEYAVIEIGTKQYVVEKGSQIRIDLLKDEVGSSVTFENVPLYVNDENVELGTPYVDYQVVAKVVDKVRDPKKMGIKYETGSYRKKFGNRQDRSLIEIVDIKKATKKSTK